MENLSERKNVHRYGDSIVRPISPWTPAVHSLLNHLDRVGFGGAPHVAHLASSLEGFEAVEYITGDVDARRVWSDDGIRGLGQLLRSLHSATASYRPPPDAEWQPSVLRPVGPDRVISHGDIAPWNVVARDGYPAALIDWELAGPVDRLREVAHTAWLNIRLFDDEIAEDEHLLPAEQRAAQLRLFVVAYGLSDHERRRFLDTILDVAVLTAEADAVEARTGPHSSIPLGQSWGMWWRLRSAAWLIRNRALFERSLE
ncbi:MAG: hypothetical protein AVDCRST_MAG87-2560 [uncultured Thermomicrobiales bacterium]|uniref:Aminoglycoside phosphotransferase domain-containing protein n=1 Tax=uncultured Thermomicrobiales bacterium TaxID=1645740 RepID=A0A6J4V9E6_9BACT|nr:MAG: hypothetical protein AVDCRST_MAG87-2560 [uncultured Thermomicrobiales bacterium]